ncbi:hypothetical protein [Nonomuraea recticatena]|uniref:Uncharacterized protein n=1 Tax=Nonomuraea recticatena TaxID=46178 RepID=A0ABN3RP96_9ACTN
MTFTTLRATRFYRVDYIGETWTLRADLLGNARVASLLRASRGWNLPIRITPFVRLSPVRVCSWCRARPRAWDWACEVRRELTTCDSAQCRAARDAAATGQARPPSYAAGPEALNPASAAIGGSSTSTIHPRATRRSQT